MLKYSSYKELPKIHQMQDKSSLCIGLVHAVSHKEAPKM
jgi:hypothetical protein